MFFEHPRPRCGQTDLMDPLRPRRMQHHDGAHMIERSGELRLLDVARHFLGVGLDVPPKRITRPDDRVGDDCGGVALFRRMGNQYVDHSPNPLNAPNTLI